MFKLVITDDESSLDAAKPLNNSFVLHGERPETIESVSEEIWRVNE